MADAPIALIFSPICNDLSHIEPGINFAFKISRAVPVPLVVRVVLFTIFFSYSGPQVEVSDTCYCCCLCVPVTPSRVFRLLPRRELELKSIKTGVLYTELVGGWGGKGKEGGLEPFMVPLSSELRFRTIAFWVNQRFFLVSNFETKRTNVLPFFLSFLVPW